MQVKTVERKTFIPAKNYFEIDKVTLSREATDYEIKIRNKAYNSESLGFISLLGGIFGGFSLIITFGMLMLESYFSCPWFLLGGVIGVLLLIAGPTFAYNKFWKDEQSYWEELTEYRQIHEDELWEAVTAEVNLYNKEQCRIAEEWRAQHPLEEKIRMVLKDPTSSVDIANLARYYALEYLKEISSDRNKDAI